MLQDSRRRSSDRLTTPPPSVSSLVRFGAGGHHYREGYTLGTCDYRGVLGKSLVPAGFLSSSPRLPPLLPFGNLKNLDLLLSFSGTNSVLLFYSLHFIQIKDICIPRSPSTPPSRVPCKPIVEVRSCLNTNISISSRPVTIYTIPLNIPICPTGIMSDPSERPSESMPGPDTSGLKPLSNADDMSLSNPSNSELSRIMSRAGIALANGFPLDDDEGDEEVDEDYVSVDQEDANDTPYWFRRPPTHQRTKLDDLHPFVQLLSVSNVNDCVKVEDAFPEAERCSRDKFIYRLTRCPELSLGLFTLPKIKFDENGKPLPGPPATLVGHIIATRTSEPGVTDRSMKLPANWQSERWTFEDGQAVGHEEGGSTIAIHSLAVLPEHQGKHVGSTLMKSYIQRIREAQIADRIAIIAHDHLVPFYESFGFESRGPSKCQFGGGGWVDLVLEFGSEQN